VTLRLIVFDVDPDTGAKSVKDIKEQDVYMGDMPLMTSNGTFIVNGTERVIVSRRCTVRPACSSITTRARRHSSGKLLFAARIIPYRGSWLDIEFDAKDVVYARIDRRRKIAGDDVLLYALGINRGHLYRRSTTRFTVYAWRKPRGACPIDAERMKGMKAVNDLIDADSGKFVLEAGKKLTQRPCCASTCREGRQRQLLANACRTSTANISLKTSSRPRRAKSSPRPAKKSPTSC